MCKLDKSFNTGIKSYSFLHWKCLAKTSRAGGAPPRTDALIGPAAFGDVQKTDRLKWRASDALSLLSSSGALTLLNMAWTSLKLRFPFSRLRPTTRAGPLDSRLGNQPFMGLRLCQSRNGATNSTIAEESFPRWRHAAISSLHTRTTEGARAEHVTPETKNSRGKTNQLRACFKTHPSKYKLNS